MTAEGDLVVLSFVRELADPKDPAKKYTTTWFDMSRIEGSKIVEQTSGVSRRLATLSGTSVDAGPVAYVCSPRRATVSDAAAHPGRMGRRDLDRPWLPSVR